MRTYTGVRNVATPRRSVAHYRLNPSHNLIKNNHHYHSYHHNQISYRSPRCLSTSFFKQSPLTHLRPIHTRSSLLLSSATTSLGLADARLPQRFAMRPFGKAAFALHLNSAAMISPQQAQQPSSSTTFVKSKSATTCLISSLHNEQPNHFCYRSLKPDHRPCRTFYSSRFVQESNYYDTLGVPKTASQKDIRTAFVKKAKEYHPDQNRDNPQAQQKFIEITQAYETLKDENKRKLYDMQSAGNFRARSQQNPYGNAARQRQQQYQQQYQQQQYQQQQYQQQQYQQEEFYRPRGPGFTGGFNYSKADDFYQRQNRAQQQQFRSHEEFMRAYSERFAHILNELPEILRRAQETRAASSSGPSSSSVPPGGQQFWSQETYSQTGKGQTRVRQARRTDGGFEQTVFRTWTSPNGTVFRTRQTVHRKAGRNEAADSRSEDSSQFSQNFSDDLFGNAGRPSGGAPLLASNFVKTIAEAAAQRFPFLRTVQRVVQFFASNAAEVANPPHAQVPRKVEPVLPPIFFLEAAKHNQGGGAFVSQILGDSGETIGRISRHPSNKNRVTFFSSASVFGPPRSNVARFAFMSGSAADGLMLRVVNDTNQLLGTVIVKKRPIPVFGKTPFAKAIEILDKQNQVVATGQSTHFLFYQRFSFFPHGSDAELNKTRICSAEAVNGQWRVEVVDPEVRESVKCYLDESWFALAVACKQLEDAE